MGEREQSYRFDARGVAAAVEDMIPHLACSLRSDVLAALRAAKDREQNERGRMVLGQLVENAEIAARDQVPLCQDTGTVRVLLEVGEQEMLPGNIFSGVDAAVARAYRAAHLRMSTLVDAFSDRTNPGDNTPAFCDILLRPGSGATLHVMLKGGGSDNASRVVMLAPGAGHEGIREVVLAAVREKASSACPPLIVGVGVGSTYDHVAALAKRALFRTIGEAAPSVEAAAFERSLLADINALGLGAGALGGDTTALAVHLQTAPCHIAALPVAVNLGCSALRSGSVDLDVHTPLSCEEVAR